MHNPIYKYIIRPQDLYKLLSYADSVDKKDLKKLIWVSYNAFIYVTIMDIIFSISIGYVVLSTTDKVDLEITNTKYLLIIIALYFWAILQSFVFNNFIYVSFSIITGKYVRHFIDEYKLLLDSSNQKYLNELYAVLQMYSQKIVRFILYVNNILYLIVIIYYSNISNSDKPIYYLTICIIGLMLIIAGRIFLKSLIKIRIAILEDKPIKIIDRSIRTITPGLTNTLDNVLLPVISIYLVYHKVNILLASLPLISTLGSFFWSFLDNIDSFLLQKEYLDKLLKHFSELNNKNIINKAGYYKQCEFCSPDENLLAQSKKNRSLIFKNFSPKKYSDPMGHADSIDFEFKAGVYQIHGKNGIGKSTFLESISIPLGSLVEFSTGQAVFDGKPLFEPDSDLLMHRYKVKCINSKSQILKVDNTLLDEYSFDHDISGFLKSILSQSRETFSEGETAVVNILDAIGDKNNNKVKVIIIDEMISRIYNIEDCKLRDSIISLIKGLSHKNNIITIIVDHVIEIKDATHLVMTEEGLKMMD